MTAAMVKQTLQPDIYTGLNLLTYELWKNQYLGILMFSSIKYEFLCPTDRELFEN